AQDPPRRGPSWRARRGGGTLSQDLTQGLTYEQALEKLDEKLKLLEDGDLSLEDALKAVDDARVYLKVCTERLEAARKKIEVRAEPETGG
ncbi:MAG TPA: exodeoxyribonuclease VII small subunit, partial [Candidatus Sulfotelmatobacter sp.]|nr:exodeoxyribonuclease VII small subunit [Candidatus Sulfotelmatobacter sp.]